MRLPLFLVLVLYPSPSWSRCCTAVFVLQVASLVAIAYSSPCPMCCRTQPATPDVHDILVLQHVIWHSCFSCHSRSQNRTERRSSSIGNQLFSTNLATFFFNKLSSSGLIVAKQCNSASNQLLAISSWNMRGLNRLGINKPSNCQE